MSSRAKKNKKSNKQSGIILTSYRKFINWLYLTISTGLIGRFFTAYSKEENKLQSGMLAGIFKRFKNLSFILRRITRGIAYQFEKSILLTAIKRLISWLISRQIKFYGTYIFSFGVYSVLSYVLKRFFIENVKIEYFDVIAGSVLIVVSLPMLFSAKPLCELLKKSVFMHAILIETFGIPDESFSQSETTKTEKYALPFLIGIISGIITYFFGSVVIIVGLTALIAMTMIIMSPEIGVLCVALLTPLFSHNQDFIMVINIFVLVTAISYMLKLLRGKRTIQLRLLDLIVLLFGILVLFGGIVSVGAEVSKEYAYNLCTLMLSYFLIVNLIKTKEWMFRCTATIVSSVVFVSLIGLLIRLFNHLYVIDLSFSTKFVPLLISLFNNSLILALMLVIVLPYTLSFLFSLQNIRAKVSVFLVNCFMIAAIISTGSALVIYTMIATLFVFFIIYTKKSVFAFLMIPVAIPFVTLFLPNKILRIFTDVFDLSAPATNSTIQTLQGSLKMIWNNIFGGNGVGTTAFQNVFPLYASPTTETAGGVPSLLLRVLSELGVSALLVFIFIIILFYQHSFEHLRAPYDHRFKSLMVSSVAAFSGMLFAGLFFDLWSDNGIFWIFWVLVALSRVYYNVDIDEKAKHSRVSKYDTGDSVVELSRKFV